MPVANKVLGWDAAGTALENKTFVASTDLEKAIAADAVAQTNDVKYMTPTMTSIAIGENFPVVEAKVTFSGTGHNHTGGTQGTLIIVPGMIVIWSGAISAIPAGWVICDGANGTPDLTDKFVIHADADAAGTHDVGDTGGSHTHTHTQNHLHSWTGVTPAHASGCGCGVAAANTTNAATGNGSATTHTPPYYALAYIMKT